eukprot:172339-Rhodomonas_salina.1
MTGFSICDIYVLRDVPGLHQVCCYQETSHHLRYHARHSGSKSPVLPFSASGTDDGCAPTAILGPTLRVARRSTYQVRYARSLHFLHGRDMVAPVLMSWAASGTRHDPQY